ncbi:hypothetical protein AABB24_022555 [Solanum stoloniferum]|uniref:Leucine-rich repeat-containing N-terminal plant-type domain-containing protein n=1 Tax=Solanum stoloniferum TaxID=62892 RepID=A0ABD2SZX6_9SOLN
MERIVLSLIVVLFLMVSFSFGNPFCSSHDSLALLQFKHSLNVTGGCDNNEDCPYPKMTSWNSTSMGMDCCRWDGITCDVFTGHVIGLDLSGSRLEGAIHPNCSLFQLRHLQTLDLSFNNVSGGIPNSLGTTLKALKILRLSGCNLAGPFPEFVRNLSQITQLDLSDNNLDGKIPEFIGNLSQITQLDLSYNHLEGEIPDVFSNLQMLTHCILGDNNFTGPFPSSLMNLTNLQVLRLRNNLLSGPLPEFKTNSLQTLDLSRNQLSGPIPQSLRHLFNLTDVILGHNKLSGEIRAEMFAGMTNLTVLDLSSSGLSWSSNINTTFPLLRSLRLGSCRVKDFPDFILNSKKLWILDLSENEIHGQFPKWFGGLSALQFLNVSHNFLTSLEHIPLETMMVLDLQSNSLRGPLPSPFCPSNTLFVINLSYNNLSGEIPNCLLTFSWLRVLDLQANNFHGPIPNKFPENSILSYINLSKNQLEGPIPTSLLNCTALQVLHLGNNKIRDTFPTWLETLQELEHLILKSNRFYGPIVAFKTESPFPNMMIFDLSDNSFTGSLPMVVLKGFKAMMNIDAHKSGLEYHEEPIDVVVSGDEVSYSGLYVESVILVMKNQEIKFNKILKIFTTIDLSRNKFEGEIPKFIGNLNSLLLLNLSHNNLTGHIPVEMRNMGTLEALDLSFNQLTGKIPGELASLTFLAVLNLSHNHLVGPIPQSNQFNTFPNDSYLGNSELCGFPLSNECGKNKSASVPVEHEEDEPSFLSEMTWQSVLMGYGCGLTFGFGIVYLIYRFERPRWFIDSFETITREMIYIVLRGRKRRRRNFHRRH